MELADNGKAPSSRGSDIHYIHIIYWKFKEIYEWKSESYEQNQIWDEFSGWMISHRVPSYIGLLQLNTIAQKMAIAYVCIKSL